MTTTFVILSIHIPSLGHVRYHTKFGPDRLSRISKTFSWKFFFLRNFRFTFSRNFCISYFANISHFFAKQLEEKFRYKEKNLCIFREQTKCEKNGKIFVNRLSIFAENLCSNPSWTSFMVFFNNFCYFLFYF